MIFESAIEARWETTVDSSGVGVKEAEWTLGATELVNHVERDANDFTPVVAAPEASKAFRAGVMTEEDDLEVEESDSGLTVRDFKTRSSCSNATSPCFGLEGSEGGPDFVDSDVLIQGGRVVERDSFQLLERGRQLVKFGQTSPSFSLDLSLDGSQPTSLQLDALGDDFFA
jgi:hypothetical protein